MSKLDAICVLSPVLVFCLSERASGQVRERSDVPPSCQWKLEDLYATDDAWTQAKDELAGRLEQISQFKGKLAEAQSLRACLDLDSDISRAFGRLYSYASMKSDLDTRASENQAMKQTVRQLMTDYGSKASFVEPEIVKLDVETIEGFIAAEPELKVYRMYLLDILRRKAHKLSEKPKRRSWPRRA